MREISISDILLRESFRQELSLSFKEKLEIAKRLSELNVDVIEMGAVSNEKADEVLIKTVCTCVKNSVISCSAGSTEDSVIVAARAVSGATHGRVLVSVPVSPVQMEYYVSKKPAAVLELLKTLTEKAVALCKDVEVSLDDATRAEPKFLYDAIKIAIDCGARTVTLTDLAGTMLPDEFALFIKGAFENVPELKTVNLSVQLSDSLSFAAASAISAVEAGANSVKTSAIKVGDLTEVEKVFRVFDSLGVKKGYSLSLNKTGISRIVKQISQIASSKSQNSPFDFVSGETKQESLAQNMSSVALGKTIKKLGYDLSIEDSEKVYEEYKRLSQKKAVNTKELEAIIASSALQVPSTYTLNKFIVNSTNVMPATASVVIEKDGKELSGLSYGNGSVDAAFLAIESVTGRHFELDDFIVRAVTEGKEAMGETVVKLRFGGKLYSGRGISTDIVGASIRAYLNAVNKIVYEENER